MHADLIFKKAEALDAEGSFLLGKMNHNSVPFEGAICQFDIYPSAKAAHNYCDYIKKQCREADTYRPVLPPLLPLVSNDPNITVTRRTPLSFEEISQSTERSALALTEKNTLVLVPTDRLMVQNETSVYPTPKLNAISETLQPGLESPYKYPTQTTTASLRISGTPPNAKPTHAGKNAAQQDPLDQIMDLPASTRPSVGTPNLHTTPSNTHFPSTNPEVSVKLKVTSSQDVKWLIPVTPAATDGFQTFDVEPTQFSLLAGPGAPGLKGEPGPPVSVRAVTILSSHICFLYILFKVFDSMNELYNIFPLEYMFNFWPPHFYAPGQFPHTLHIP